MVKTEAIVSLEAGADWRIEEIELEEPRDDELLVEMVAAVRLFFLNCQQFLKVIV
jgi:Zn-dependent alcohol dehydrogenase